MLKNIFYPTTQNVFVWLSSIYLFFLLYSGKITPMTVLFVYFLETIIIGVFNALKMFWSTKFGKSKDQKSENFGLIIFFLIHYGFFVGVQSILAFSLFKFKENSFVKEPFHLIENYGTLLSLEDIKYALPAILFMHFGKFTADFLGNRKYQKMSSLELMAKPYIRIFIQQFVVILASFFMIFSAAGIFAAIFLILFRLFIDLSLEAIKEDSKILDYLSEKLANDKVTKQEIKKQLLLFTE